MNYKQQITQNKLKEVRNLQGLTQQQVATILGFQITDRISHWEKDRAVPSLINLCRLCSIYNVPPERLYESLMTRVSEDMILRLRAVVPENKILRNNV